MLKQRPDVEDRDDPVAISSPPKPPAARPKFQPKKSPEMTAPTPSAQSDPTRAVAAEAAALEVAGLDVAVADSAPIFGFALGSGHAPP